MRPVRPAAGGCLLSERDQSVRDLLDAFQEPIFVHDGESGELLFLNRQACRHWGMERQQALALSLRQFEKNEPPHTKEEAVKRIRHAASGVVQRFDWPTVDAEGRTCWLEICLSPVDWEGRACVLAVARSVDDRKQAEAALQLKTSETDTLLERLDAGFFLLDRQLRIAYVNSAAGHLLQRRREDLMDRPFGEAFPEMAGSVFERNFRQVLQDGKALAFETLFEKAPYKNWYDVHVYPRPGGIAVLFRITTERRQLEEQLRLSHRLESVGRLAGGVAHDFNNLLMIISGYNDLLMSKLPEGDSRRDSCAHIQRATERAADLTRQLLAFSRRQMLQPRTLDLNQAVQGLEKMLRRVIGEDIKLELALAPDLQRIVADPGQIEQVIFNLALNARDALPAGGRLTIETANVEFDESYVRTHVGSKVGSYVMLAVSDNGRGMDEETRLHLFEPFYTTKEVGKGSGLGLSVVYGIVKQSGGNIYVYSEPGHGTVFKIYLPRAPSGQPAPAAKTPVAAVRGNETVLLVEDEDGVRELISSVLGHQGYRVVQATDGKDALRIGEALDRLDLLVTDVVMPEMGGGELARRIRQRYPNLRILYISGYTSGTIVHHGVVNPGTAFLQKPFSPQGLVAKVREVLEGPPA